MLARRMRDVTMTVPWNLFLLTVGGVLFSLGLKSIAMPHAFISGGVFGTGLYIYYATGLFTPAVWYVLLNLPIFVVGWLCVSRRFFFYSLYGTAGKLRPVRRERSHRASYSGREKVTPSTS